jgi:hypothetical protein
VCSRECGVVAGGSWVAREDVVKGVWGMSVGEGFMTRRAVALELICVAQGHVAGELFIYVWV